MIYAYSVSVLCFGTEPVKDVYKLAEQDAEEETQRRLAFLRSRASYLGVGY